MGRVSATATYSKSGTRIQSASSVLDILPRLKSVDSYCAHPGIEPE